MNPASIKIDVGPPLLRLLTGLEHYRSPAYRNFPPHEPWTVGYGFTGPEIVEGSSMDLATATSELAARAGREIAILTSLLPVSAPWLAPQHLVAVASLTYNIGLSAFAHSTLRTKLLAAALPAAERIASAGAEFLRWDHAGGVELPALLERRKIEQRVFLLGLYPWE